VIIIGNILILIGAAFLMLGALGIIRMPDVYNRLQAGTKATTLGAMSLVLGVGLINTSYLLKSLILIVFIALSNPISSSTIARASHRAGVSLYRKSVIDKCEDNTDKEVK